MISPSTARTELLAWTPPPGRAPLRDAALALLDTPSPFSRTSPHHFTTSTILLRSDASVLLTFHPKFSRWLQLGGHLEVGSSPASTPDTSFAAAALREATEESGIPSLTLSPSILDIDVFFLPPSSPCAAHYDVCYLAFAPDDALPLRSDESLDLAWHPLSHLPPDLDAATLSYALGARRRAQEEGFLS